MAFVAGHNTKIFYDNAAGSAVNISAYVNSIDGVDLPAESLETSAFGSDDKTSILGLKNGHTISLSGDWDATLHAQVIAVRALSTGATQTLTVHPAGDGAGTPSYAVETLLTGYGVSSSVGDKVTYSLELQATGATTLGNN
jgi:hypothetical protein